MDIVYFLVSINKISLIAFLGTLGFLGYEVYLFQKEKQKKAKPTIPKFEEKASQDSGVKSVSLIKEEEKTFVKPNNMVFLILIIFLVVFGIFAFLGFVNAKKQANEQTTANSLNKVDFVVSKGIKIFSSDFQPLSESELNGLKEGNKLVIGVETIKEADIDMARIRINKQAWDQQDVTDHFDKRYNVFYKDYMVASGESNLKIEAELHSKQDGWLGE